MPKKVRVLQSSFERSERLKLARVPLLSVLFVLFVGNVCSQESNYRQMLVANRVFIEIPKHWDILGIDQRKNLAAASDAMTFSTSHVPNHISSLAVNARPYPPGAIIRVSMIPTKSLGQSDIKQAIYEDQAGTLSELRIIFRKEIEQLATKFQKQGLSILGNEVVNIESIDGKIAISCSYRRTAVEGPSIFKVKQYHVPLGEEKVLITLSFRESEAIVYSQIIDYVKNSIIIR